MAQLRCWAVALLLAAAAAAAAVTAGQQQQDSSGGPGGAAELGPGGAMGSCWRTLAGRYRGSMGLTDADEVNITAVGPPGRDSARYVANSYTGFRNLEIVAFVNDTISAVPGNAGPTLTAFNASSPPCSAVSFGKPGSGWCREEVCGCGAPTCGCQPGPGCAPARPAPPAGSHKYPGCTACNHPFTYKPYPGPSFVHPLIHHSPDPLHIGGWHDMTGALTHGGQYHTWQGCMEQGGWCHSSSEDLVHWQWEDMGVHTVKESWNGFISGDEPCSGFMTVDEQGRVCAGFRQCEAGSGPTALNPKAHSWDAPLEIRCTKANDTSLSQFGTPEYIIPVYWNSGEIPYDPPRPWKDDDGFWYQLISGDACNATNANATAPPGKPGGPRAGWNRCPQGGSFPMWRSKSGMRGPWIRLGDMFTTNTTGSAGVLSRSSLQQEFGTSDYLGGLPGDSAAPGSGGTRLITSNVQTMKDGVFGQKEPRNQYWLGRQHNGSTFEPMWNVSGHYDYGVMTMAKVISKPQQVAVPGRRTLVGWIGGNSIASQSLARDLSLSPDYELLQQFVPELQKLRKPATHTFHSVGGDLDVTRPGDVRIAGALQLEIIASFDWGSAAAAGRQNLTFGVRALGGAAVLTVDCDGGGGGDTCQGSVQHMGAGPLMPLGQTHTRLHAIIDSTITEAIWNNRTAMVVYVVPPSAAATTVTLFGVGSGTGVKCTLETWALQPANNLKPFVPPHDRSFVEPPGL
eukprot:COSAG01_NODE_2746_length_7150_cov_2.735924_4_plen_738_part_00